MKRDLGPVRDEKQIRLVGQPKSVIWTSNGTAVKV